MRLILHAGTHKTGTTSIQKALYDNRDWLRKKGLVFPEGEKPFQGTRAHLKFTHNLASEKLTEQKKAKKFVRDIESDVKGRETVIISSEAIYRHVTGGLGVAGMFSPDYWEGRDEYLKILAKSLENFDIELLLCFRSYEYFLVWLHRVAKREGAWESNFDEFQKKFYEQFRYDRQLDLFARHFQNISTFEYEKAATQGLITSFFEQIKFPTPPNSEDIWERPSKKTIVPPRGRTHS